MTRRPSFLWLERFVARIRLIEHRTQKWIVGKVGRKVEAAVAKRRGLTPEQYEARKPIFRFDLGGWPFQKQAQGQRQEINGWVFLAGGMSVFILGKYLSFVMGK